MTGGVTQTDKQYTGQQQEPGDAALGLYNYKARFYSTLTGRFVSADTSTADGLNRYAYVRDNPIRYSDPSGQCALGRDHCSDDEIKEFTGCALGLSCHAPKGITSDDWATFSRWVLRQSEFWGFVSYSVHLDILSQLVHAASNDGGFGVHPAFASIWGVIPMAGWARLGQLFGVSEKSGTFFRASLHDLVYGTDQIGSLSPEELAGGNEWWGSGDGDPRSSGWGLYLLAYVAQWESEGYLRKGAWASNAASALGSLWASTVSKGQDLGQARVNAYDWSLLQITFLEGVHLNVDEAKQRAIQRILGNPGIPDCVPGACLP